MSQGNKKRIIVVLGMHRSGTSPITRGLSVLKVDLGNNLMPAVPGINDTGFWEDMDIFHFNEKLLKKLQSHWHGTRILDKNVLLNSQFQSEHDRAVELLKEKTLPSDCFGFKDPRTAILLPFWQKVFSKLKLEDCYLISLRNPLSVAESLGRRDGLDLEKSFLLWIKHSVEAIRHSQGKKRVVVDYDLLLASPKTQLERVSKALKLPSPSKQIKELEEYTGEFLSKGLRHHTANRSDLKKNKAIPPFVRSAYFWLSKLARDEAKFGSPAFKKAWCKIEETYHEFSALYGYFDQLDLDREKLNADLEQSHAEREQLKAEQDGQITDLNQAVTERDSEISGLNQTVAERDEQITDLNQAVTERDSEISGLNQTVAERDEQITDLNQVVAEGVGEISGLNQTVAERDEQIASLNQALEAMRNSTSWRITAPLRWVGKQIRRALLLRRAVPLAFRYEGGAKTALRKAFVIFYHEGIEGVKNRVRFLLARESDVQGKPASSFISHVPMTNDRRKEVVLHQQSVDIIVCVHNALNDVRRCLESVVASTMPPYLLIIVDDGSDSETKEYLKNFVIGQPAILIRNETATGYTRAANAGIRASSSEFIVLLNSDTIVPPRWLDRLIQCAASDDRIGMVGPLSNTASWQSVPKISDESGDWAKNPLPEGWSVQEYANEVARVSPRIYPRVGFLNGFCLLIKRLLINEIGVFDEETFGRGFGEENDYCLRAVEKEWQLVVADDCYVFHAQSKSYSNERRKELSRLAGESLADKHGQRRINEQLALTRHHPALEYMKKRCESIAHLKCQRDEIARRFEGKRVLFLLPSGTAGGGGNIVLLEAMTMRELGVDAWIVNLEIHRELFERHHPGLQCPVLYLSSQRELTEVAQGFDAAIATLYVTVFWLEPLLALKSPPALGYYIQDFEPDFFAEGSPDYQLALSSYTAINGINLFTKTQWTRSVLKQKLGLMPQVIGPSVDIDTHHPSSYMSLGSEVVRLLAMVRPSSPRRGPEITMRVLKHLKDHFGNRVQITIFGVRPDDSDFMCMSRDFPHQCLGELTIEGVSQAMAQSDIFIDCSSFQAMGLTAMEAMASGVVVVGPVNGGLREIIENSKNGLLVDTRDEEAIFSAVSRLIDDREWRDRVRSHGFDVLSCSSVLSIHRMLKKLFPLETSTAGETESLIEEVIG